MQAAASRSLAARCSHKKGRGGAAYGVSLGSGGNERVGCEQYPGTSRGGGALRGGGGDDDDWEEGWRGDGWQRARRGVEEMFASVRGCSSAGESTAQLSAVRTAGAGQKACRCSRSPGGSRRSSNSRRSTRATPAMIGGHGRGALDPSSNRCHAGQGAIVRERPRHMLQATTEAAVCAYGCAHAGRAVVFQIAYRTSDGVAAHVPPRCPSRRGERGDGVENNAIAGPVTQLWSTASAGGVKGCEYHVIATALVHIIDSCVAYCARHSR